MSKKPKDYFYEPAEAPPPTLTVVKDSTVIFVYPFPYCYECCLVFSSSITNYYFFVRKLQTMLQSNNLSCCPSLISHFPFHGCYIKFLNIERNFFFLFCQFQLLTLFFCIYSISKLLLHLVPSFISCCYPTFWSVAVSLFSFFYIVGVAFHKYLYFFLFFFKSYTFECCPTKILIVMHHAFLASHFKV